MTDTGVVIGVVVAMVVAIVLTVRQKYRISIVRGDPVVDDLIRRKGVIVFHKPLE